MTVAVHDDKQKAPALGTLIGVYVALMVLLGLTVLAARFSLGALGLIIALAIAGAKAVLVVLVFMHVKYQSRATAIFAGTGLVWLGILLTLTMSDYVTRGWTARDSVLPGQRPAVPAPRGMVPVKPAGEPVYPATRRAS